MEDPKLCWSQREDREIPSRKLACMQRKSNRIQVSKRLDTVERRVEMSTGGRDFQQSKFFLHSISKQKGDCMKTKVRQSEATMYSASATE